MDQRMRSRHGCDWDASTKLGLEHLYLAVVPGGTVIIDDDGTYEGYKKAIDEFMAGQTTYAFLNRIDTTGRYGIKPLRGAE